MKRENLNTWIALIALTLSVISLALWFCKYDPVTWTFWEVLIGVLSFLVTVLAVLLGYNIFFLRQTVKEDMKEVKTDIDKQFQELSKRHQENTADFMIYVNRRLLHMAAMSGNMVDVQSSFVTMFDAAIIKGDKEDIEEAIKTLNIYVKKFKGKLMNEGFKKKMEARAKKIAPISEDCAIGIIEATRLC